MKVTKPDSTLVSYVWPNGTSNYNIRDHKIDTITIHHVANGTGCDKGYSANTLSVIFTSVGRAGSVNYGIDSNGKIGQMLNEKYRPWTSNSRPNDMRAITAEIANCGGAPDWKVSDKALKATINLCVDICKRNGKKRMVWIADKNKALAYSPKADEMRMTLHKWFAATGCPEKYLISKMQYIADEANKLLGSKPTFKPYIIKVIYKSGLNIRSGAGVAYKAVGEVPCGGVYTIVEEHTTNGQKWGRLKSGAGWICVEKEFVKKLRDA